MRFPLWMTTPLYILGLEDELAVALDRNDVAKVEEIKRKLEATADKELVKMEQKHIIERQFAEGYEFVKELIANAMDSYARSDEKFKDMIEISLESNKISVEDFGKGLTTKELLSYLLVVGSTDKRFDEKQVGTHGLGFFSALKSADDIYVESQNLGLKISRDERNEYQIEFMPRKKPREGTMVTVYGEEVDPKSIESICEFVDPQKYTIVMKSDFSRDRSINNRFGLLQFSRKNINVEGEKYDVDFYVYFAGGIREPRFVYTQDGLRITSTKNEKNKDLIFVADLPPKARIPRSRNSVPENLKKKIDSEFLKLNRRHKHFFYMPLDAKEFEYLKGRDYFRSKVGLFDSFMQSKSEAALPVAAGLGVAGLGTSVLFFPVETMIALSLGMGGLFAYGIADSVLLSRRKTSQPRKGISTKDVMYEFFYGMVHDTEPVRKFIPSIEKKGDNVAEKVINLRYAFEKMRKKEIYFYTESSKPQVLQEDVLYVSDIYQSLITRTFLDEERKRQQKESERESRKIAIKEWSERNKHRVSRLLNRKWWNSDWWNEDLNLRYNWRGYSYHKSAYSDPLIDTRAIKNGFKRVGKAAAGGLIAIPFAFYEVGCVTKEKMAKVARYTYTDRPLPNYVWSISSAVGKSPEKKTLIDLSNYISSIFTLANGSEHLSSKFVIPDRHQDTTFCDCRALNLSSDTVKQILEEIKTGHLADTPLYNLTCQLTKSESETSRFFNYVLRNNIDIRKHADKLVSKYANKES